MPVRRSRVTMIVRKRRKKDVTGAVPARPIRVDQQRGEPLHPVIDGDVIHLDVPFGVPHRAYPGRPRVVDLGTLWCGPCARQFR